MHIFVIGLLGLLIAGSFEIKTIKFAGTAQGTTYHITYYAEDTLVTRAQVDSIFEKIDSSLSLYKSYSLVNRFNQSQHGLEADEHLANVVRKSQEISGKTGGLFDITIFPLTDAWGFGPVRRDTLPSASEVKEALSCVNTGYLSWQGNMLLKAKPCVQLDPNGIAQGYTVDVIAGFFERMHIRNYIIEVGGEIRIKGRAPGNKKMSVGIELPGSDADYSMIGQVIYPGNGAVTTSGNYRRYYESGGRHVTHLLNPKTGMPLENELISVTIVAKDAITADGYDNAVMAMGLKTGLAFIEKNRKLAAHFIYRKPDGTIGYVMSRRFKKLLKARGGDRES